MNSRLSSLVWYSSRNLDIQTETREVTFFHESFQSPASNYVAESWRLLTRELCILVSRNIRWNLSRLLLILPQLSRISPLEQYIEVGAPLAVAICLYLASFGPPLISGQYFPTSCIPLKHRLLLQPFEIYSWISLALLW